jgi:hypothetical protein
MQQCLLLTLQSTSTTGTNAKELNDEKAVAGRLGGRICRGEAPAAKVTDWHETISRRPRHRYGVREDTKVWKVEAQHAAQVLQTFFIAVVLRCLHRREVAVVVRFKLKETDCVLGRKPSIDALAVWMQLE